MTVFSLRQVESILHQFAATSLYQLEHQIRQRYRSENYKESDENWRGYCVGEGALEHDEIN